jgi:hypothetical protein
VRVCVRVCVHVRVHVHVRIHALTLCFLLCSQCGLVVGDDFSVDKHLVDHPQCITTREHPPNKATAIGWQFRPIDSSLMTRDGMTLVTWANTSISSIPSNALVCNIAHDDSSEYAVSGTGKLTVADHAVHTTRAM